MHLHACAYLVPARGRAAHVVRGPARVGSLVGARLRLLPAVVPRRGRLVVLVAAYVARLAVAGRPAAAAAPSASLLPSLRLRPAVCVAVLVCSLATSYKTPLVTHTEVFAY